MNDKLQQERAELERNIQAICDELKRPGIRHGERLVMNAERNEMRARLTEIAITNPEVVQP